MLLPGCGVCGFPGSLGESLALCLQESDGLYACIARLAQPDSRACSFASSLRDQLELL